MAENLPKRAARGRANPPRPVREVVAPDAPAHLSGEAGLMWSAIVEEWHIDASALPLLRGALESWDAYQVARGQVARDGPTFRAESGQIKAHPAAKLALDNFAAFRQAMRQLGLEPPKD